MLFLLIFLEYEALNRYVSYSTDPDTAILVEISQRFPELSGYVEFVRQRDFGPYDVERAMRFGTPRSLLRVILAKQLKSLYENGNYEQVIRTFERYSHLSGPESKYYYILSLKKEGKPYSKEAYGFIRSNYRSEYAYRLYRNLSLKLDSDILVKLLYFNRKYRQLIRTFSPDKENAFYLMSAYFKMRKYDKAHGICSKWKNPSSWRYYLRCAIASEKAGDTSLALFYIGRLHRYKPEKSIRLLAWFAIQDSAYLGYLMNLPNTHDEVFFVKSMLSMRYGDTAMAIAHLRSILNRTRIPFERSRAYFWLWKMGLEEYRDSVWRVHPFGYYAMRIGRLPKVLDRRCIDSSDIYEAIPALLLEAFGLRRYAIKILPKKAYLEAALLLNKYGFYPLSIYLSSVGLKDSSCTEQVKLAFPMPYRRYFLEAADSSHLPISLLYAIAREESRFDSSAVSTAGARGIIQMMPFQFRKQIKKLKLPHRPFEVRINLLAGAHHFAEELEQLGGDYELTICAYNAGKKPVEKWIRIIGLEDRDFFFEMIPYRETRNYFRRVFRSWQIYRWLGES